MDVDGTKDGYDIEMIEAVRKHVTVPLIASGRGPARRLPARHRRGADAVLAASVFHFGDLRIGQVKEALRGRAPRPLTADVGGAGSALSPGHRVAGLTCGQMRRISRAICCAIFLLYLRFGTWQARTTAGLRTWARSRRWPIRCGMKLYRAHRGQGRHRLPAGGAGGRGRRLVSYHLRKLAEHGVIEEGAGTSADGRSAGGSPPRTGSASATRTSAARPRRPLCTPRPVGSSPSSAPTCTAVTSTNALMWDTRVEPRRRVLRVRDAATAGELSELVADMQALFKAYTERGRAAEEAGDTEGRENVAVHTYAFPFLVPSRRARAGVWSRPGPGSRVSVPVRDRVRV